MTLLPELLAPAGDFAAVDAALTHGADAVYTGIGTLNLRAHAPNFSLSDVPELLERVHGVKKKLYFTLNTMPDNRQIDDAADLLTALKQRNVLPDAFIVSDPGIIDLCREIVPHTALHLSTQSGTFNTRSIQFWKKCGIVRVVLPREMTLPEITQCSTTDLLETEVFIHGAMCVSVSGRCLLGAYFSMRHPNRGDCSQPCRWKYALHPLSADGAPDSQIPHIDAEESENGSYFMNSRDLCTISLLPDIIRTGVSSLKIEGRNKSIHYVGSVVKAYRMALNHYAENPEHYAVEPELMTLLDSVEHRPYTTGFYGNDLKMQEIFSSKASSSARIVGIVKALLPGGIPVIDVKNSFSRNETIEVIPVNHRRLPFHTQFSTLSDLNNNRLEKTPSNRLVVVSSESKLQIGDMLRIKTATH